MKTSKLITVCFIILVLICAAEIASAQSEYEFKRIHLVGMDTSVVAPDNRMEEAWLHVYLGSTVFTDACPEIGVPSMTLSIKIWPEVYHDETLVEETPRYKKCDDDPYYVLGGEMLVNDFADSFETMIQYGMIPDIPVVLNGQVNSWTELYDLTTAFVNHVTGSLCYIPGHTDNVPGYWLYGCRQIFIPVHWA